MCSPVGVPNDLPLTCSGSSRMAQIPASQEASAGRDDLMNVDVLCEREPEVSTVIGTPSSSPRRRGSPRCRGTSGDTRLSAGVDWYPNFPARSRRKAHGPAFKPQVCTGEDSLAELTARLGTFRPNTAKASDTIRSRAVALRKAADTAGATVAMSKTIAEEAGKTLVDAVNEVRELVDFFRFYANQAETHLAEPSASGPSPRPQPAPGAALGPWLWLAAQLPVRHRRRPASGVRRGQPRGDQAPSVDP